VRAAIFNEPRNITTSDRPDATIREPSDAVVRVVPACVCGSDLWRHADRQALARELGATDSVVERGNEAVAAMDERRAIKSLVRVGSL
jgi:hypothetical protein